ncbi:uncharacterized protein LOC129741738 [Uranotaenia lowii]|uniref:uncharacterized protein LOC129741738 n=1 Tax=Uranotaenia lowii TaxID=190385 RepID=UPI002479E8D3|nr:uncharacterized protein LOC129741738 [Uranotaenia lowii]
MLINGNLSPSFPIQRSVRQGDPLSMNLFVLYLHPPLENLLSICNNPQELVLAYADDITIIVKNEDNLQRIVDAFSEFEQCSGTVLNTNKTMAINIGTQQNTRSPGWFNLCDSAKILGVIFFNSSKRMVEVNWGDVIRKTSQLMWKFKPRILSLLQKITIINSFVTSTLWFMASILGIPNASAASQIGNFVWERHPTRVSMEQIGLAVEKGGLYLQPPSTTNAEM